MTKIIKFIEVIEKNKEMSVILAVAIAIIASAVFVLKPVVNERENIDNLLGNVVQIGDEADVNDKKFVPEPVLPIRKNDIPIVISKKIEKKKSVVVALPPLSSVEIKETIGLAVDWLKESQEENGHFRYEYSVLAGSYAEDDLMVRQTGALYVLAEVLRRDRGENYDLKETIQKSIAYFEENSADGKMNGYRFRCVLRTSTKCSLGAVGLTLIGILDLVEVYPELEPQYRILALDYLNYILAMKKPGEGFRGWYYLNGNQSETESDFSNGEAFLTLARYYESNPTKEVKAVIDDSFDYFNIKYGEAPDYNFYLWGMGAIKKLYAIEPLEKYYNFVKPYTDWRISSYKFRREALGNMCAYFEGVISAYSVLEPNVTVEEKGVYLEEINFWLSRSKGLQVDGSGSVSLVLGSRPSVFKVVRPDIAEGGFLTALNNPVQRIDYTQHCLSSYLQKQVDIDGRKL